MAEGSAETTSQASAGAASCEIGTERRQMLQVLEFAATQCEVAYMQTPAVMAALGAIAREQPETQADLSLFWHALQLRRPEARRHDAAVALRAIRARLDPAGLGEAASEFRG